MTVGLPRLTEVFRIAERDGSATDARLGSAKFNPPTDPDLEDEQDPESKFGDLDEAAPGDPAVLKGLGAKVSLARLATFPWRPASSKNMDEERHRKDIDGVRCLMSIMPDDVHAGLVGRGRGSGGWMLDLEIKLQRPPGYEGPTRWVYHVERRYPTIEAVEAARQEVMDFVDAHSLTDLMRLPRSGPLQMSAWRDGQMG